MRRVRSEPSSPPEPAMNKTLSSHVTPLRFSVIRSMLEKAAAYDNVISLSIGEPDFDTPAFVCEAAMRDASRGFTHYAPSKGDADLRAAILEAERAKSGLPWTQENLLISSGAMHALLAVMRTILDEGDEVLTPAPSFSDYLGHCVLAGGRLVQVPTSFENDFLPTLEAMEAAVTPKTRVLIVNSPCNPSGVVFDAATLDMLADFAKRHDLIVISDEVYDSIVFSGKAESIATRPGMSERTVVLNSFSKAFAMTGWRVGYALGPSWLMQEMVKVLSYSVASTGSPNQRAALAALTGPQDEFHAFREAYRRRTKLAAERLNAMPGVRCLQPSGTFYLFPHVDAAEKDSLAFALDLLDKAQVIVVPGFPFGPEETVRGCIRIACTVDEDKLSEAMDRMEAYLKSLPR